MKLIYTLVLLLQSGSIFSQNWQQIANFSGNERDDGTSFTIGNKVYCGLGMNAWFGVNADFQVFDLNTETWSQGVSLPAGEERQYANGFSHNGMGYVFGGTNGSEFLNDLWQFDPSSGTWQALPPMPSSGKAGALSFVIADTVYIAGGKSTGVMASDELWAFDLISQQWSQKNDLPFDGMWRGVNFVWNEEAIIGLGKMNDSTLNENFYQYFPVSDSWQLIPGLSPEPATHTAFAQIGKVAFLYGGVIEDESYSNSLVRIDLETFDNTNLTAFPAEARRGGMAFTNTTDFFVTTGVSASGRLNETWKASYVLSLDESTLGSSVSISPNPAQKSLKITSSQTIDGIQIFDMTGKTVFLQEIHSQSAVVPIELTNGMYILQSEVGGQLTKQRLMIAN